MKKYANWKRKVLHWRREKEFEITLTQKKL